MSSQLLPAFPLYDGAVALAEVRADEVRVLDLSQKAYPLTVGPEAVGKV